MLDPLVSLLSSLFIQIKPQTTLLRVSCSFSFSLGRHTESQNHLSRSEFFVFILSPTFISHPMDAATDDCCSTQLIDGDGGFNVSGLDHFIRNVKLAACGLSYAVVAIMGPQSSDLKQLRAFG
ncbi:hypothetical protein Ahy_B04g069788 isoform B [Arachis hypogaea]|uniref:Uncharacterized protein n=1 Tax=Arachis hypogaea TaxID=3818 RepID=A0A444ZDJ0_ARAHY|nr:hypothetical protein Ahy_B04g069788 isoform B [Arachis hypogaea]